MADRPYGAALPDLIPIFPLPGVLLLPRGRLPLNIFEHRYLAMTRAALAGERLIGMIQPLDPALRPAPRAQRAGTPIEENPPLYRTGCAGRITSFTETDDNRYLITLTGVSRFDIGEELPLLDGYRRVVPDWSPYAGDLADGAEPEFDRDRLVRGLRAFFQRHAIAADWEAIAKTPGERLVTSIAMICPFAPSEKQALLEAPDLTERARLLSAIVEMAAAGPPQDGAEGPRH